MSNDEDDDKVVKFRDGGSLHFRTDREGYVIEGLEDPPHLRPLEECPRCRGAGMVGMMCHTCCGSGEVVPRGGLFASACPDCDNLRCRACGGTGKKVEPRTGLYAGANGPQRDEEG